MSNCLGFNDLWKSIRKSIPKDASGQQKLNTVISQYRQQFSGEEVISEELAEGIATDIYKGFSKKLIPLTENDTIESIKERLMQRDDVQQQEPETNPSNLVDPIKQSSTNLDKEADRVFGVYDTKKDVIDEFLQKFTQTIIWDPVTGKTPNNAEEMNAYIQEFQQSLYDNIVNYLILNDIKVPENFYNDDGTSNYNSVYQAMENIIANTNPYALKRLKENPTKGNNRLKLEAIKSHFQLKYFDALVLTHFKGNFKLSSPAFSGKFTTDTKKYTYGNDANQATDWFNQDKKSPKDIMSKRIANLLALIPYLEYGENRGKTLSTDETFYAIRELKDKLFSTGQSVLIKNNGNLINYGFTKQERRFINRVLKHKKQATLEHLFAVARTNIIDGYSVIFKVLNKENLKKLGLTKQAENVIDSLQKYVFGESSNTLKHSAKDLYQELVHTLDFTSSVTTSRYSTNEYDQWEIRQMSPINRSVVEGQVKESINSIYDSISVEVLTKKYNIEEHYDENDPTKSFITFEINNRTGLESYLVQVDTYSAKVNIRRKSDNKGLESFTQSDFNSLLDFVRDSLGVNLKSDTSLRDELFRKVGTVRDPYNAVLKKLIPLATMTLSTGKLMRSFDKAGLNPTKAEYQEIGQKWGLIDFSDKKSAKIRYQSLYEGYDVIHANYLGDVKDVAECKAMADRAYSKSVMPTSEGTKIPVNKLAHLNADRRTAIVTQVETKESALRISPDEEGAVEEYITDYIDGWSTSREAKYASGGKQTVTFNFNESLFSAFCLDFLSGFSANNKRYFQFTEATVSDKPNSPKIFVRGTEENLNIDTLRQNIINKFGRVNLNIWNNITKDFDKLQNFINTNPIEYKGITIDSSLKLDYNNNFKEFNQWVISKSTNENKLDAGFLLNKICLEYNKRSRFHPIEINENVHKRGNKDGNGNSMIELNKGFMTELMRWNRDANGDLIPELSKLTELSNEWKEQSNYWWEQQQTVNYFNTNDLRLVDDLLSNRARINVLHDTGHVKGQTWAKRLYTIGKAQSKKSKELVKGTWVKINGDVIFAKVRLKDGREIKVSNSFDLAGILDGAGNTSDNAKFDFETIYKNQDNGIVSIDIHPLLRKWNLADYYYTTKSTLGTVGATWWCDAKRAKNTDFEVESAINDFQKRNVTQTATVNQFALGTLGGIADKANIVVFKQPSTVVNNSLGDSGEISYWDGATYTGAFQNYWENNSLSGTVTGVTKKPIMHFYNERFALAQLNKTASFAITNYLMRTSIFHQRLHWKASKDTWLGMDGRAVDADITKDYMGNTIDYNDCYYEHNGHYYRISKIEKIASDENDKSTWNQYHIEAIPVNINGEKLEGAEPIDLGIKKINSNYALWEVLGGIDSLEINEYTKRLQASEYSIQKVADVACKVGQLLVSPKEITSQDGIFQFMKHSDKHYIVTDGAFKKAPGNLNSFDSLTNDTDDLNFIRVNMTYSGIQLDPTHQADNSEVSLMTQVISALADRGYTKEAADLVYSALGEIAKENLQPFYDAYSSLLKTNSKDEIISLISEQILGAFKGSKVNSDNLLETISKRLHSLVQERGANKIDSESLDGIIPWSEESVSSLINSTVTSTINKLAIKIKTFGSLSVLNPSHGTILLYGDRKLNEYTSAIDFYNSGKKLLENKITGHNFRMGRYYRYTDKFGYEHNVQLTLAKYYDFIANVDNGNYTNISETFLGNETTIVENSLVLNNFPLNSPYFGLVRYYKTAQDAANGNALYKFQRGRISTVYQDAGGNQQKYYKIETIQLLGRDLDTYNVFFNGNYEKSLEDGTKELVSGNYTVYDLKSVHDKTLLHAKKKTTPDFAARLHQLNRQIQRDFVRIHNNEEVEVYDNGTIRKVKVDNHETHSYGILLPMIYRSKLGLRDGDVVSDIVNDKDFFFRRQLQNIYNQDSIGRKVSIDNYDVVLRRTSGDNIYIKLKDGKTIDYDKLHPIDIRSNFDMKGQLWREDHNREALYKLYSESDVIYQDKSVKNGGEVIFTDAEGLKFYVDQFRGDVFDIQVKNPKADKNQTEEFYKKFNEEKSKYHKSIEDILKDTKYAKSIKNFSIKSLVFDWSDEINNYAHRGQSLEESKLINQLTSDSRNHKLKDLYKSSRQMHTAFLESLKVLAARIPSQGMASFMTMKVEGFTDVDINDCFISDMQIWLQGSDFDVDKVTLMGSSFSDGGRYIKWSRYMFDDSADALRITQKLRFPTGEKVKVVDNNEVDLSIYEDLFDSRGNLNLRQSVVTNSEQKVTFFDERPYDLNKLEKFVDMINKFSHTLEGPQDSDIRGWIETIVNNHNLTKFSKDNKNHALSNIIQHVATEISRDIRNCVASQQGTDDVSGPLKDLADESPFGTKDYKNRYGNAAVKLKQVITNQTGKSGIAITASVGIKAFFAITQYMNTKLAQAKTQDEILKYTFDVSVDGENYRTIANINVDESILKEWETSENMHLRDMAASIRKNDNVDADTTISGIMTLAVDNAKELKLAKLNASSEILGLYIYGVSVGIPFEKLVKIFTSNVADVLNQNIKGNIFNNDEDVRLGQAISALKFGPFVSKKTLEDKSSLINKIGVLKNGDLSYKSMADMILGENGIITQAQRTYSVDTENYKLLRRNFITTKLSEIKDKLDQLYISNRANEYDKRFVNESYEYIDKIYRMYSEGNIEETNQILTDIETLYGGKKEYSTLKNLILNQGVKVLENEQLTWLNTFSNVIKARLGKNRATAEIENFKSLNNDSLLIDIIKYTRDSSYRQAAIDAYESIKHTVNILEVIDSLPHFSQYLKGYGASNIAKLNSSKYEAKSRVMNMLFNVYELHNDVDKTRMLKRVDSFLNNILYNQFLRSDNVPDVIIQAGNTIIDSFGETKTLNVDTAISLGTDLGNTNFKLWVENTVLPDLQQTPRYNDNSFIGDLISRRYKGTQFGNLIRGLTLPIDMIPRSDSDIQRMSRYKFDFNELTDNYRNSGLTIQEIFYLYSMITYQGKHNTRTLTAITDTLYTQNNSIADKARSFISTFDKHSELVFKDVDQPEISNYFTKDELIYAVAPTTREVNYKKFKGPYLTMFNYKTLQWELLERIEQESEKTEQIRGRNEYDEDLDDFELDQIRQEQERENDERWDTDEDMENEYNEENEDVTEQQQYQKSYKDIYTLFRTVSTFNSFGAEGKINKTLGKLPQTRESQLLTQDIQFIQYNENTTATIESKDGIISSVKVVYRNGETEHTFDVSPRVTMKIINGEQKQVVDNLDMQVKISKEIRKLLKVKC